MLLDHAFAPVPVSRRCGQQIELPSSIRPRRVPARRNWAADGRRLDVVAFEINGVDRGMTFALLLVESAASVEIDVETHSGSA
jgi:hypothetical protein